jgi:hypothetical protein
MKDKEWLDYIRRACAGSDCLDLNPCPFCGKREYLRAGHESAMAFAVQCMRCRCTGPIWSYGRVIGEDEYLLPEVQAEVDKRESEGVGADLLDLLGRGPLNYLDAYLLEMAINDWNMRDGENDTGT